MHSSRDVARLYRDSPDGGSDSVVHTLADILQIPCPTVQALLRRDDLDLNLANSLTRILVEELVVTSTYSGTGAFESGVHKVSKAVTDPLGLTLDDIRLTFYAAWEVDEVARNVLLEHPPHTRPQHIFGNVLDRIPRSALDDLFFLFFFFMIVNCVSSGSSSFLL